MTEAYYKCSDVTRLILELQLSCLQEELDVEKTGIRMGANRLISGAVNAGKYEGLCDLYKALEKLEVTERV